ncbi:hypothetical protein ACI7BZ_13000 [Xanthobacter sp. AM11]|uniref:hypothetical protein n=1 Tax=Xanthobacter sp. AM11 TaxID=3380643 RepID=UPI0039BFD0BF
MSAFALRALRLIACSAALLAPAAAGAEPLGVVVRNESVSATCAETDNVTLTFSSDKVEKFRIMARHPAYIGTLLMDRTDPDFETCDMSRDPVVPSEPPPAKAGAAVPAGKPDARTEPRRVTIFETPDLWLTGYIFPSFWRAATVPFRVGGEVTQGLHMVQVWVRHEGKAEEVLVVYPPDGYWRARPLSPAHMRSTAYGSSFLVGPVEQAERPLVRLKEIDFAPQTRTFTLHFAEGGKARMQIAKLDRDALFLEVQFDGAAPRTFAALRSMYVTEGNADVARVAWRGTAHGAMGESPVMSFSDAENVAMFWAGRLVPSRHNTSAPDYIFEAFSGR